VALDKERHENPGALRKLVAAILLEMRQEDGGLVESQLRKLETELLQRAVRSNPGILSSLLAAEFCEFGSSGRIHTRQETIDALSIESPARFTITDFSVTILAPGVALVRYQAARHDESGQGSSASLRSSLWVLKDQRWRVLFHQGTKVPFDCRPAPVGS
jgi:hypothetical protein